MPLITISTEVVRDNYNRESMSHPRRRNSSEHGASGVPLKKLAKLNLKAVGRSKI